VVSSVPDATSARLLVFGVISYGFYVFHPFLPGPQWFAHVTGIPALADCPRALAILLEFAEAVVISALSWHFFERRFLRLKARRPAPAAVPSPGIGPVS